MFRDDTEITMCLDCLAVALKLQAIHILFYTKTESATDSSLSTEMRILYSEV